MVQGKGDRSSPDALFIIRAFVISFDVFGCSGTSQLCSFSWTLLWGSATRICCLHVLNVGRTLGVRHVNDTAVII